MDSAKTWIGCVVNQSNSSRDHDVSAAPGNTFTVATHSAFLYYIFGGVVFAALSVFVVEFRLSLERSPFLFK